MFRIAFLIWIYLTATYGIKTSNEIEGVEDEYDEWTLEGEADMQEMLEYYANGDDALLMFNEYMNGDLEADKAAFKPIDTVIIVIYSIITVVGLLANAVVLFVIFAGNEIGKTVTAIYVLQLTIADTVFLFTLPVFSTQKVLNNWSFPEIACTLCQVIKFMNYYAGIFFLMAMSVDRYVAVAYSTRLTKLRTKFRTYIVCIFMWLAATLMSLPLMMYARTETALNVTFCRVMFPGYDAYHANDSIFDVSDNEDYETETMSYISNDTDTGSGWNEEDIFHFEGLDLPEDSYSGDEFFTCSHDSHSSQYKSWLIVDFIFGFVVPFIVIVISYVKILTHLKTSEEKIGHTASNRAVKMRKRVTRMVAALVVCFTVCWLPHHLFTLAKIRGVNLSVPLCYGFEQFLVALAFSNSAINPILYTFMGNNFRERLRKSVDNTSRRLRKNSRQGSIPTRHSSNTHSDPTNPRKFSGLINYRRGSKNAPTNDNGTRNTRKLSKLSQLALLGSHRPSLQSTKRNDKQIVNMRDDRATAGFYATTTIGEQTVETKL